MNPINLDAFACPHCGTSGASNLESDAQITYTGHVDGDGWIHCPDCGTLIEFTEDGEITLCEGANSHEAYAQVMGAMG